MQINKINSIQHNIFMIFNLNINIYQSDRYLSIYTKEEINKKIEQNYNDKYVHIGILYKMWTKQAYK